MNDPDPVAIAAMVAAALEQIESRYVLGGSLASTTFGEPRSTLDIDIAAELTKDQIPRLAEALGAEFRFDSDWACREIEQHGSFQIFHDGSFMKIDMFVPEWTGFDLWKWETRRRIRLDEDGAAGLDVTAPEAVVLQKLLWFEASDGISDRQWRDVVGVLKTQRDTIDREALADWAERLDVSPSLHRAMRAAGIEGE